MASAEAAVYNGFMKFSFAHNNINVLDLERSLAFYREALGLAEVRRFAPEDGSFILVFLGDGVTGQKLELTWLRGRQDPYDLGDNEVHIAFRVDDFDAAYKRHKEMGVVCYENTAMGIYFIADPDGYWLEILPPGRG
jgi:lactoylglutathione lyase